MTILVTGSSGFIGSNLIKLLKDQNEKFVGLDKNLNKYLNFKDFTKLNLLEFDKLNQLFKTKKFKYVIHLAAIPGFVNCHKNPRSAFDDNVIATLNIIFLSNKYKIKKLLIASSMGVDNFHVNPSIYGLTKFICEKTSETFNSNYKIKSTILKISNVFGPYSFHKTSVVHEFIKSIIFKKKINIHNNGLQKRDFIYVEDVCKKILNEIKRKKYRSKIIINNNKFVSIINLMKELNKISKKKNQYSFTPTPKGYDDKDYKFQKKTISTDFLKKLHKTYNWYNNNLKK